MDRESGKENITTACLSLSLLSLERRDPTRAGLNWAGHIDGEQGRAGAGAYYLGIETGWAQGKGYLGPR